MRIHSEFVPLTRSAHPLVKLLNGDEVFDGGYARVVVRNDMQVLKATACPATNKLFQTLREMHRRRQPLPEALPAVLQHHGQLARDADGIRYRLWSVERLFKADDLPGMRRARVRGKVALSAYKPAYHSRFARGSQQDLSALNEALLQERRYCAEPDSWQACSEIALAMSLRTEGPLKETFLFLNEFVTRHQLALDLLTQGNILFDMFGRPCLSDPVCEPCEASATAEKSTGLCVVATIPVAVEGVSMLLEPRSSLPMNADEREALQAQLQALGVAPRQLEWNSPQHVAFLGQGPSRASIWELPDVCRNLRQDAYMRTFCA